MSLATAITDVSVATIQGSLPAPVVFGDWIMRHREYAVVRVTHGLRTRRLGLHADPRWHGRRADPQDDRPRVRRRGSSRPSAPVPHRVAPQPCLPCWSASGCEHFRSSIWRPGTSPPSSPTPRSPRLLGGRNEPMPATAIIGYPPGQMGPEETGKQTAELHQTGWRRFKAPVAATAELSADRLRAARANAPDAWIGCDAAWIYDDVEPAVEFVESIDDVGLGWFEDVFPPGDAGLVRRLRERVSVPDRDGRRAGRQLLPGGPAARRRRRRRAHRPHLHGRHHRWPRASSIGACSAGVQFAPHMFAHVHSQVFSALGFPDVPVEWGVPWTGVDPYADSLAQPADHRREDGAAPRAPGFGGLLNLEWATSQTARRPATTSSTSSTFQGGIVNITPNNDFSRRRFLARSGAFGVGLGAVGLLKAGGGHRLITGDGHDRPGNCGGWHLRPDALRRPDGVDPPRRRRARRPRPARQARRDPRDDGPRGRGVDARPRRPVGEQQPEPARRRERLRHRPHPRLQRRRDGRRRPARAVERLRGATRHGRRRATTSRTSRPASSSTAATSTSRPGSSAATTCSSSRASTAAR